jgi:hypothetical protein
VSEPEAVVEQPKRAGKRELPVVAWVKAFALAVKDTARDMLDEGRRGANEAYEEYWRRYEEKTKHRRRS